MKIQLEHNEIKMNVDLQGIESDKLQKIAKNLFNTFLDSIHIVNNAGPSIMEEETEIKTGALQESPAQNRKDQNSEDQKRTAQEKPDRLPGEPEDDQQAMADALAAYEKAQAEKLAAANVFGLGKLAQKTPPAMLEGLHPSTYRQQGGRLYVQAFVVCTDCRHKDKHYIERGIPFVNCRSCGKRNSIRPATTGNFPHVDAFGNFYIGGAFKRADEREVNLQAIEA